MVVMMEEEGGTTTNNEYRGKTKASGYIINN